VRIKIYPINGFTVGIVGSLIASVLFDGLKSRLGVPKQVELPQKIELLTKSLSSAARDIKQIEDEIAARQKLVERLKADAETAQALSALNQKQTEAIAQSLRGQLEQKERETFWWSIGQNVFFAALGAVSCCDTDETKEARSRTG